MKHPNGGAEKLGTEVHVSADSYCNDGSVIDGRSAIFTSTLIHSVVRDSCLVDACCELSELSDVIADHALLREVKLQDTVVEHSELIGPWSLKGNARIPTGIWHRAPRYKRITGENGVDIGLTESTSGYALMACWRKPITLWLKAGPRLGQKHRWTEKQINDARLFFTELLDVPLDGVRA